MLKSLMLGLLAVSFFLTAPESLEAKLQPKARTHTAKSQATKTHAPSKRTGKQSRQSSPKQSKQSSPKQSRPSSPKKQQQTKAKVNKVATQNFQTNAAQVQANISSSAAAHIQQRHWFNAQQGPNTSHFSQSMTIQKLNQLATTTINNGSKKASTHGQGRSTYQYRFSTPLGTDTNGQTAYALRVVADQQFNVITAFPVN